MTKISKKSAYPLKNPIVGDYFVGTDSENEGKTINFGFEQAAELINKINGNSPISYRFITSDDINTTVLTEGYFLSKDNKLSISDIDKLYINKNTVENEDIHELYDFLKVNSTDFYIKLQNRVDINNSIYLNIIDIESYGAYYVLNVNILKGNYNLPSLVKYGVYLFDFQLKTKGDKGDKGDIGADGAQGIQGIAGLQGLKGDTGDKGDTGLQGIQGVQGLQGTQGITGADGVQGLKGDKGNEGTYGEQGMQGDRGIQGIQGIQGEKGDIGLQGIQGIQGIQGEKGDVGNIGMQGIQGVKGTIGDTGAQGEAGATQDISGKVDKVAGERLINAAEITKLGNQSGTNTGDQDLTGLVHTNRTSLDLVSGTNTGDNATNTQYSGLVTNATHTGDVTGATALTIGALKVTDGMLAGSISDGKILSSATWNAKQNALTNPVTGTGTTNYLPKFNAASALGNSQIFDNGVGVGIGTTSPASVGNAGRKVLQIEDTSGIGAELILNSINAKFRVFNNNVVVGFGSDTVSDVFIFTGGGGNNRIHILANTGNVGIGTTTPTTKLDVRGSARVADDVTAASASNVGAIRYRVSGTNSYAEMCMQTGATTYAWKILVEQNWV
jgi:hypothetical protein